MRQSIGAVLVVLVIVLVGIAPMTSPIAHAQGGGTLGYGSRVFGRVLTDSPVVTYSFTGSAGDLVQVNARNWVGTLDPQVDLIAPDGQLVGSSGNNALAEDVLEAQLALFLPQTGIYLLNVSGQNGTNGEFLLKLYGRGAVAATPLVFGQGVDVNIPTNPPPQYFSFEAQACPTVLTVTNLSEGQPFTFPFVVRVRNQQGQEIAYLRGGDALEDRLVVAPQSGRYEVEVISDAPQAQGAVNLIVTCADQAPGCIPGGSGWVGAAGECPPCFGDEFGGEMCRTFDVTATDGGGGAYTFTWTEVEGAEYYIFSIVDGFGTLLADSPILLDGIGSTTHTYTFRPEDLGRGPFRVIVSAGAEGVGTLCLDDVMVSFDDHTTAECAGIAVGADVVPGEERLAVAHWDAVPGAAAYTIHVYAVDPGDGGLIGIRVFTVPGSATTYHLSGVFPAEYSEFQISVHAYSEATGGGAFGDMPQGFMCAGETNIRFGPIGPVEWGPAA
ncbi:MAG: hypothetical protein JW910_04350 [Anaerolineae bacterium]|nr:hypothetical protein [Anaerolineae bacterium]